jgi:hypothetical protein
VRGSQHSRRGQRDVSRRKGVGEIAIEVRLILVEDVRRLGGRQREGLGLWERIVEKEINLVNGWIGEASRYRCLGAGRSRLHVRCRWEGGRERIVAVKLVDTERTRTVGQESRLGHVRGSCAHVG